MNNLQIARINQLAKKSKTAEGLTPSEKEEQAALRKAYVAAMRGNLEAQLKNVRIMDGGKEVPLQKKKK